MLLKLERNENFLREAPQQKTCSAEDDLLKIQHGAERSALAWNIHEGWRANLGREGRERLRFCILDWRVVCFMPGPIDRVDE